jgi:hypothetical protein
MPTGREDQDTQLARIELLLKAARLEVVGLRSSDHELRRAICGDLDDMLKTLRASVQAVLIRRGLRERGDASSACESNSPQLLSIRMQEPSLPVQRMRKPLRRK